MTRDQQGLLDDTLNDLADLPLTDRQKAQILQDEARKLNSPIPDAQLDEYLRAHGLPT